ncbi:MAG: DUF6064 family protein [Pseudomonadota bacterium]|jgi:hypothetical protein
MSLPFTVEQFLDVLVAYNKSIWPLQTAAYAMGVLAVMLLFKGNRTGDRIIIFILAVMWIWTGVVYHITFFSRINQAAYLFGALTVLEGILILLAGYLRPGLSFRWRAGAGPAAGAVFILYAMVLYPLFGYFSGHIYPRSPVFGVTPCPVTIFTFGLFLLSGKKVPVYVLIIPLMWSLVGGSAAWNLGVPEDYGLILAGVGGSVLILLENRRKAG